LHPYERKTRLGNYDRIVGNWVREKVLLNQVLHAASQGYWQTKCNLLDQTTNNKQEPKGIGSRKKRQKKKKIKLKVNQVIHYQHKARLDSQNTNPTLGLYRRKVAAKTCHGSYTSHYVEGMMLHVWPTTRDSATHNNTTDEHLRIGTQNTSMYHLGMRLLRADVAHGGCFGSKGNSRFHMVFRKEKEECHLGTDSPHMLDWSVEESVFQEAKVKLDEIGSPSKFFKRQSKMAKIL
jgi:hypothetical protein